MHASHEGPAPAPSSGLENTEGGEAADGFAQRGPRDAEARGELAFGRQPVAGVENADGDGGEDPIGDLVWCALRSQDSREIEVAPDVGDGRNRPLMLSAHVASSYRAAPSWHLTDHGSVNNGRKVRPFCHRFATIVPRATKEGE